MRLGIYVVLLFAACAASGQTAPALPGTFGQGEPLPAPVVPEPGKPSPAATPNGPELPAGATQRSGRRRRLRRGQDALRRGRRARGRARLLEAFVAHHAQHPARPAADLMLARLALARGDAETARGLLSPLTSPPPDEGTGASARYYLGLAERAAREVRPRARAAAAVLAAGRRRRSGRRRAGRAARRARRGDRRRRRCAGGDRAVGRLRARRPRAEKAYARERITELAGKLSPDAGAADLPRGVRARDSRARCSATRRPRRCARAATASGAADDPVGDGVDPRRPGDSISRPISPSRPAIRGGSGWRWRSRGGFSRSARRRCARRCWRRARRPPRRCSSACATRAASLPRRSGRSTASCAMKRSSASWRRSRRGPRPRRPKRRRRSPRSDGVPTLVLEDVSSGAGTAFHLLHSASARAATLAATALQLGARDFATGRSRHAPRRPLCGARSGRASSKGEGASPPT